MEEGREMSVGKVIAELEKPPGESEFDWERLLAHLHVLAWFRNHTGDRARAYLAPFSVIPLTFVNTKEEFLGWLRAGQENR